MKSSSFIISSISRGFGKSLRLYNPKYLRNSVVVPYNKGLPIVSALPEIVIRFFSKSVFKI